MWPSLGSLVRYAETSKKVPSWLYKIGTRLYVDRTFPRHLFIETTAKCNLTCSYCPREDLQDHMDFSLFKDIVDEASRYGARSFSLHLFGEPLLWPHIIDGIRYIKHCNKHHNVILTTNGTHLNRFVNDLIGSRVDEIIWSWRKEARFKDETTYKLRSSTKSGKTIFRVRILKEVTPPEAIKEWEDWPCVEMRSLHNYGGDIDLSRYGVPSAVTRWPCYHLWFAPAVAWNGDILLCCVDPHHKEVLGRFPEQSISEVWQGRTLKRIRQSHREGRYEGICRNCDVWKNYPSFF